MCTLPFWHTHMDTLGHTATHSVAWVSSSSRCHSQGELWGEGPITDLLGPHKLQPCDMWRLWGVREGTPLLYSVHPPFLIPEKTESGRNWLLTMKSWQFIMVVTGGRHSSGVNSVTGAWFCHGWVFQRVWGRVRVHMAEHVNPFSSQLT